MLLAGSKREKEDACMLPREKEMTTKPMKEVVGAFKTALR